MDGEGAAVCPAVRAQGCMRRAMKFTQKDTQEAPRTQVVGPLPGEVLQVSARMVGSRLRVKTSASTAKVPEMSGGSTQMEVVKKDTLEQMVGFNECPDPSPEEKVSTCKRCAHIGDLLRQVAELQGCAVTERPRWRWGSGFRTMLLWWTSQRMRHPGPWWPTKAGLCFRKKAVLSFSETWTGWRVGRRGT